MQNKGSDYNDLNMRTMDDIDGETRTVSVRQKFGGKNSSGFMSNSTIAKGSVVGPPVGTAITAGSGSVLPDATQANAAVNAQMAMQMKQMEEM